MLAMFLVLSSLPLAALPSPGFGIGLETAAKISGAGMGWDMRLVSELSLFPQDDDWNLAIQGKASLISSKMLDEGRYAASGSLVSVIRYTSPPGFSIGFGGGVGFPDTSSKEISGKALLEPGWLVSFESGRSQAGSMRITLPLSIDISQSGYHAEAGLTIIYHMI